jgi:hypothetical protein
VVSGEASLGGGDGQAVNVSESPKSRGKQKMRKRCVEICMMRTFWVTGVVGGFAFLFFCFVGRCPTPRRERGSLDPVLAGCDGEFQTTDCAA